MTYFTKQIHTNFATNIERQGKICLANINTETDLYLCVEKGETTEMRIT